MYISHTGSLVIGGFDTFFPRLSSWNCSSCTTNVAKLLLVGGSVCTYYRESHKIMKQKSNINFARNTG